MPRPPCLWSPTMSDAGAHRSASGPLAGHGPRWQVVNAAIPIIASLASAGPPPGSPSPSNADVGHRQCVAGPPGSRSPTSVTPWVTSAAKAVSAIDARIRWSRGVTGSTAVAAGCNRVNQARTMRCVRAERRWSSRRSSNGALARVGRWSRCRALFLPQCA